MQKVLVTLEIPTTIPSQDLAHEVAEVLVTHFGAQVLSLKVSTEFETIVL